MTVLYHYGNTEYKLRREKAILTGPIFLLVCLTIFNYLFNNNNTNRQTIKQHPTEKEVFLQRLAFAGTGQREAPRTHGTMLT